MKNIGILGYGTVGRATAKHLSGDWDRQIVAYDEKTNYAKHVNTGAKVKMEDGARIDALVVCINVPHTFSSGQDIPRTASAAIRDAIIECSVPLREAAPILIRSTVPPGTCDNLQIFFPHNPVMAWPEFSKEQSLRQGYEIKALYLGLSPAIFNEDKGDGRMIANMLLKNSGLIVGAEVPEYIHTNLQVEFAKLAWNVRRASDIAVFNEITRGAVALGIEPTMAEYLTERAAPSAPSYSTLAFGGRCLNKDLWMWDAAVKSTYGHLTRLSNASGPRKAVTLLNRAWALMGMPLRRVAVLGLQDGPSSGECAHSPAMEVLRASKWEHAPAMVDSVKAVREKFKFLLTKKSLTRQVVVAPDDEALVSTNAIIIAQKAHGPAIYNSLIKILQTSAEPIKIVVNACNMPFYDSHIIEAQKWGAVFVDQIEIDRMRAELETRASQRAY